MAVTLAELMKGRAALKEEDISGKAGGMESIAKAIEQGLAANPNVSKVASSITESSTESKMQDALLREQKKTNSLLGELITTEKKYFEENKELIDRLLMAQEQMLERKSSTVEAIGKTTTPTESGKKEKSGPDFVGAGLGLGPLIGILGALMPEIIKLIKEVMPETLKKVENFFGDFLHQSDLARDADRAALTASRLLLDQMAKKLEESAARNLTDEAAKKAAAEASAEAAKKEAAEAAARDAAALDKKESFSSKRGKTPTKPSTPPKPTITPEASARQSGGAAEKALDKLIPSAGGAAAEDVGKVGILNRSKAVAKKVAAGAVRSLSKRAIPFIGAILTAADAGYRVYKGDVLGAIESVAAGSVAQVGTAAAALGAPTGVATAVGVGASLSALAALAVRDVYNELYKSDPIVDYQKDPEGTKKKLEELGPIVWEALQENWHALNDKVMTAETPESQYIENENRFETGKEVASRKVMNMTKGGKKLDLDFQQKAVIEANPLMKQAYDSLVEKSVGAGASVTANASAMPRIDRDQTGGQVIYNDNKTINNVDNSKAGGGGGASGFPNTSSAPKNPWDGALYGD